MSINVLENGRGGKCVYKWMHAYVRITKMEMRQEAEDKDMSKVRGSSIDTVSWVSVRFVSKVEIKLEDGYIYKPLHKPYICTYR